MAEREAAKPSEGEHEGLSSAFHEKAISLGTMDLRLLLPTGVAIALVVACGALVATRGLPWPQVSAGVISGTTLGTIPLPVAVLATVMLVIAWSFILAGALHAHLVARVIGAGGYAAMGLASAWLVNSRPGAALIVVVVLSVVAAAVGLYLTDRGNHHQAPHLHHRVRLRIPTFGWALLATAIIFAVQAAGGVRSGRFVSEISFQLTNLEFVLIPVLVLAGTDFAEWSEVVSGRIGSALERLPRPALLGGLVATGLGVLLWAYLTQGVTLEYALEATRPEVVFLVLVAALGLWSLRRPTSTRVPFWALGAGALLIVAGVSAASWAGLWAEGRTRAAVTPPGVPALVAVAHTTDPTFRALVPQTWSESLVPDGWMWSGPLDGRPSRLVIVQGPADSQRALTAALGSPTQLGPPGAPVDDWTTSAVTATVGGQPAQGEVATRGTGDQTWVLATVRAGGPAPASTALFDAVRSSWSADPQGEEESEDLIQRAGELATVIASGASSLVLIVLGLVLLLAGRGEAATGGLFLTLCGLFQAGGFEVAGLGSILLGLDPSTHAVGLANLLFTSAVLVLAMVVVTTVIPPLRLPKPLLRLLLVLFLGLIGLLALEAGVFQAAETAARFTIVAGVVLVAAMLWDVLMSGESITNTGGHAAPRHTRVLIYLGYILMVVTAVMFFGAEQVQGGGSGGLGFESEIWPQSGIGNLGPPLLLTFFFVNFAAWRRHRPMGRADGLDQVDRSMLDEVAG